MKLAIKENVRVASGRQHYLFICSPDLAAERNLIVGFKGFNFAITIEGLISVYIQTTHVTIQLICSRIFGLNTGNFRISEISRLVTPFAVNRWRKKDRRALTAARKWQVSVRVFCTHPS